MPQPIKAISCPHCHFGNASGSLYCERCRAALRSENETQVLLEAETVWSADSPGGATVSVSGIHPGEVLNDRYEILELLGAGGMGAVYKTRDRELDRVVALKIIRPELGGQAKILERFKQELLLARQVTHKNVIRIFDLGSAGSLRFITMEYVEGRDLAAVLRDGKPPIENTIAIMRQVCQALDAAHGESVVHRDLKPQNMMVNAQGKVWVMDFGLAFSVAADPETHYGGLLGTPAYMSPEQAQGLPVDARSDIYAVGLILYEMLTGDVPFRAETMMLSLMKRTQGPPPDPLTRNAEIPKPVSGMVMKCLAVKPEDRYASAAELLRELDRLAGDSEEGAPAAPPPALPQRRWKVISGAVAATLAVAAVSGVLFRDRLAIQPAAKPKTVTVLVADFTNGTGDPVFDNTLESMFNIALEGATFVNAYNRGQARRISTQLQPGATRLDEALARLVAMRQSIDVVLAGSIQRNGNGYQIEVKAVEAASGKKITSRTAKAATREAVLAAVPALSAPIRKRLGDSTPESAQLAAAGGPFAAASLDAVHAYGVAMEQQFAGKMADALQSFAKAAELDPQFARAYSGMAAVAGNLGRTEEAEKNIKLAMQNVGRMTDRERLRTRGLYYAQTGDAQKCVEEYSELVKQYPADNIGHNNLANCLSEVRNMPGAVAEARIAVQLAPKSAAARNNLALFASYNGDFETAEKEARAAHELNQAYAKAYMGLAFSQLGLGRVDQALEAYRTLEKLNGSWAAAGAADIAIYQGRYREAGELLRTGADQDATAGRGHLAAAKLAALGLAEMRSGHSPAAVTAAANAIARNNSAETRFLAARLFVDAGDPRGEKIAAGLIAEIQRHAQAFGELIQGYAALKARNPQRAIQAIEEGNRLLDTWIGRFDLGRAYLEAGLYAQADGEFDKCIRRRGEAISLFADECPTYGLYPPVYYYQGLAREGLKSPDAKQSFAAYLAIRGEAGQDPLLEDARKRAGQ